MLMRLADKFVFLRRLARHLKTVPNHYHTSRSPPEKPNFIQDTLFSSTSGTLKGLLTPQELGSKNPLPASLIVVDVITVLMTLL